MGALIQEKRSVPNIEGKYICTTVVCAFSAPVRAVTERRLFDGTLPRWRIRDQPSEAREGEEMKPCVDPLPHWMQIPVVFVLMLLAGAGMGFSAGIAFEHYIMRRFREWSERSKGGR